MENYNQNKENQENDLQEDTSQNIQNKNKLFKIKAIIFIISLVILILGSLYIWNNTLEQADPAVNIINENINLNVNSNLHLIDNELDNLIEDEQISPLDDVLLDIQDSTTNQLGIQGTSDDISGIELDFNASELGDINLDDLGF